MVRDGFKKSAITLLIVHKVATIIMSYLDDVDYSSSDEEETKESGILGDPVYRTIFSLIHTCYLNAREPIKKSPDSLVLCLSDWKYNRPNLFRIEACMYPAQFDELITRLKDNEIFSSNFVTGQEQISVDKQLLIALRRFGTGEKIHSLAMWAGIGYGTVDKITQRVFTAIYSSRLREMHICWPCDQETEEAKEWAETQAYYTWQVLVYG